MEQFIELTLHDQRPLVLNVEHISSIQPMESSQTKVFEIPHATVVYCGKQLYHVMESFDATVQAIEESG